MTDVARNGERTVWLFSPVERLGLKVEKITLRAFRLDDQLRWAEGRFPSALALLAELADLPIEAIRAIEFPDADRIMQEFIVHIPQVVRDDINRRVVPLASAPAQPPPVDDEAMSDGAGLDLGEQDGGPGG